MADFFKKAKESVVSKLEFPEEVLLNYSSITIISNIKIEIENHLGVILFTEDEVKINTKEGLLIIKGKNLMINDLMAEEITLKGKIEKIEFLN